MRISIIHDLVRWEEKSLLKAANDRGIEVSMMDVKDMDMDLDSPPTSCYRFYYRTIAEFTGKLLNC